MSPCVCHFLRRVYQCVCVNVNVCVSRFAPTCTAACEALGVEVSVNAQVPEEGSWKPA